MSELSPQHPPQHTKNVSTDNGDGADDSLSRLHRMSRTAGLGTQEYVAINVAAICAFLLGLGSALSLVAGVLLIIPIAGVICGIVALWQISNSNGTQAGKGWATSGIVLSLLFAGIVGTAQIVQRMQTRADRNAVMQAVERFGELLAAGEIGQAYDMFGDRLKERLERPNFEKNMRLRFESPYHGKVLSMRSNGRVAFQADEGRPNAFATTQAIILLDNERSPEDRTQMGLSKVGDEWVIEGFGWFPPEPRQPMPAQ